MTEETKNGNGASFKLEFDKQKLLNLSAIDIARVVSLQFNYTKDPIGTVTGAAAVLASVVTSCPKAFGEPDNPETYQKLGWLNGQFGEAVKQLLEAANEHAKK